MRFYAVYAPIANRPGYWGLQGGLFADCDEAVAAMSGVKLRDAVVIGGEEMWEFSRAVLPEEEVLKRRIAAATAS